MTASTGRGSVGLRLRWLERLVGDLRRSGCDHCRRGYGARVSVVRHREPDPPFAASCSECGRAYQPSEGVRVFIRGMDPATLARMHNERAGQVSRIAQRGPTQEGGTPCTSN